MWLTVACLWRPARPHAHAARGCRYRAQCAVVCAPGYEDKATNFTCGLNGEWAGALSCTPKQCDAGGALVFADPAKTKLAAGNCSGLLDFPTSCTLGCTEGYAPEGSLEASCTADGTMSGPVGSCGAECGDGLIVADEVCDEGEHADGDGCALDCKHIENGFACDRAGTRCTTVCGDGTRAGGEQCDDGNNKDDDGCSGKCTVEEHWGCVETPAGMVCDGKCGDGVVAGFEECDGVAGCSKKCRAERGFTCADNVCTVLGSCVGLADGVYQIIPGGTASSAPVVTQCAGGYAIIDPAKDMNWLEYFNDRTLHEGDGFDAIYAPSKENLIANRWMSWKEWFKPGAHQKYRATDYALSADCRTCANPGRAYMASGNYVGCKWHNDNCHMLDDMVCKKCISNYADVVAQGTCTHIDTWAPRHAYRASATYSLYEKKCQYNWWHLVPSLGARGKFCVCFKLDV